MTPETIESMNILEKLSLEAHPPLERQDYEGWTLTFSEGYTRRANSVQLYDLLEAGCPPEAYESNLLSEKFARCERIYAEKGLPCIFKITDASPEWLTPLLESRGYHRQSDSLVMTVDAESPLLQERLESIVEPEETGVIITSSPDEAWLNAFFVFEDRTAPKTMDIARRQFQLVDGNQELTALYCRLQMWGKDVAVASAVMKDGVVFLLNVVVKEDCRGNGYGKILVKEILEAVCAMGAEKLCLQVLAENQRAQNMYRSFGYEKLYGYWYMKQS